MKKFLVLIAVFGAFSAQALPKKTIVRTLLTCERNDRERWTEVGITQNPGPGLSALVVVHDINTGSPKLVANRPVVGITKNETTVYEDSLHTLRLTVTKKEQSLMADLAVIQHGPGGFMQEGFECIENSTLTYEEE